MPFNGSEGKIISSTRAKKLIRGYLKSARYKHLEKVEGGFFGKKKLLKILNQKNCVGIRYYHARNEKKKHTLVLVGQHTSGKPMENMFMDDGPLCPPFCG